MIRYKGLALIMALTVGSALIGCKAAGGPVSVIQAPLLSNSKQGEVKETLEKLLPAGVEYLTPKNAEQKQAIFIEDIDKDGKQEAFIVYKDTKEIQVSQVMHLLMLKETAGNWNKVSDTAIGGSILDYFKLENLDGAGSLEVIAGVGIAKTEPRKQLFVYEAAENELVEKVQRSYEALHITDYNEDKKPDLLLLGGERNIAQTAEMFNYEKGSLKLISVVQLDPSGYHENVVSGKLLDGKQAMFIDSGVGAHSMLTEIIAFNEGKLVKVGNENDKILFKAYPLYSKDINNDGIIEVGGMYIPKGYEDTAFADIPFIHVYADYKIDGTSEIIEERYSNSIQNFYITIPSEWREKVTIKQIDNGIRLLANSDNKVLFEVKWIDKKTYNETMAKLGETKDIVFYTDMKQKMVIPKDNFHLLEEEF
ncbi:MAG: hypothetical protein K0Q65_3363 [Clostridia bacterium]|nr:hypothetical protein [Clostridia bacterium]